MDNEICISIHVSFFFTFCHPDCLDNGNNKKALQEAAKLLRKQENFLCAKVYARTIFCFRLKTFLLSLFRQSEFISVLEWNTNHISLFVQHCAGVEGLVLNPFRKTG